VPVWDGKKEKRKKEKEQEERKKRCPLKGAQYSDKGTPCRADPLDLSYGEGNFSKL